MTTVEMTKIIVKEQIAQTSFELKHLIDPVSINFLLHTTNLNISAQQRKAQLTTPAMQMQSHPRYLPMGNCQNRVSVVGWGIPHPLEFLQGT